MDVKLLIGKLKRKEFTILELAFARGKESQAIYIPSTLVAAWAPAEETPLIILLSALLQICTKSSPYYEPVKASLACLDDGLPKGAEEAWMTKKHAYAFRTQAFCPIYSGILY